MKLILSLISALIVTYSCSPINNQHGYILEDFVNSSNSISQFNMETTTENDILQTLGSPSIIINDVNNIWIYLVSIKKENIFENDTVMYQSIMRYEFDNNGKLLSKGNLKDMHWTFEQIIERVSYGSTIFPGDIIGSGPVGTGSLLEINGSNKLKNVNYEDVWLKEIDIVEMEIENIGRITNKIICNKSNYKIN